MLEEYLKYGISMNERITLTSDFKPLSSQPDGPWQAGAGGYHTRLCVHLHVYMHLHAPTYVLLFNVDE